MKSKQNNRIINFQIEHDIQKISRILRTHASEGYVSSLRARIYQRFYHPEQLQDHPRFEDLPELLTRLGQLLEK